MSNALAKYIEQNKNLKISADAMADALQDTVAESQTGSQGLTYLNFSGKKGVYSLGRDKDDVDPEAIFALEPQSVVRGWQCWKGSKPIDKVEWSVFGGKAVGEEELTDHSPYKTQLGEGWKKMVGFGVIATDRSGMQIKFTTDSVSGRNAVSGLLDELAKRARSGTDHIVPLMSFDREEFKAQEQTNFKPKFVVHTWATREQIAALLAGVFTTDDVINDKAVTAAVQKQIEAASKAPPEAPAKGKAKAAPAKGDRKSVV
jgi:hypothetical protein